MTYDPVLSTTQASDLPGILTGVTERAMPVQLGLGVGTLLASAASGGLHGHPLATTEEIPFVCPIPPRVDGALGATIEVMVAPATTEASKVAELEVDVFAVSTAATGVDSGTPTETASMAAPGDVAETAEYLHTFEVTATSAIWGGSTTGYIAGTIRRIVASSGTDLTGHLVVMGASLRYTIER